MHCISCYYAHAKAQYVAIVVNDTPLSQTHSMYSHWAARNNTWLLIKLTPKGVLFSFLFYIFTHGQKHRAELEPYREWQALPGTAAHHGPR